MIKLKVDEAKIIFKTTIPVLVNHLNYGNHLGYDSVLSIIQEARMRWLKQYGLGEKTLQGDIGYLIGDVILNYKSEAFHGDILSVGMYIDNIKSKSFDIKYIVKNEATDKLVAVSLTSHVCFNFQSKKVVAIPFEFQEIISKIDYSQKLNDPHIHLD